MNLRVLILALGWWIPSLVLKLFQSSLVLELNLWVASLTLGASICYVLGVFRWAFGPELESLFKPLGSALPQQEYRQGECLVCGAPLMFPAYKNVVCPECGTEHMP